MTLGHGSSCRLGAVLLAAVLGMFSLSPAQGASSDQTLRFRLPDTFGRVVDAQDYAGQAVLIMSGSCWCGGCQQDAEPLKRLAAEYVPRGLATLRTVAGDNELAALDFQRHYHLPFVQLMDTDRAVEKRYNRDGWTFLMLADPQGTIVYKVNGPHDEDWAKLRDLLDGMLPSAAAAPPVVRDGIAYSPATLKRSGETDAARLNDRFPSLACGPDGKVYVVFTTNRNGTDDVFIRVFDGTAWSQDMPLAATDADEYDATVLVDTEGRIWACWTAGTAAGRYDVFVASFTDPSQPPTPENVSQSDDDAMHPRMVCDEANRIWLTYYKWHKMGEYSRDKEVYLRRWDAGRWFPQLQVSPTDVPQHEDHSDPAISTYGHGAVVAWSWDFHPPNKGYSTLADKPTIFMRLVGGDLTVGAISSVSGKQIDVTPSIAVTADRRIWCCWDSQRGNRRKQLAVSTATPGRDNPASALQAFAKSVPNVCTPTLATDGHERLTAVWSELDSSGRWALKCADIDTRNESLGNPTVIEAEGNPRYPAAAYDPSGRLWVAYSVETNKGRQVTARMLEWQPAQPGATTTRESASPPSPTADPVRRLREAIDQHYSYRDLRNVPWDTLFKRYTPLLERAKSPRQFAEHAAKMLGVARDMHVWVKVGDETIGGFRRSVKRNYNLPLLAKQVPNWQNLSSEVSTGRFPNGIGYVLIKSWRKDEQQVLAPALQALRDLADTRALIIDVRPNGGGSEPFAQKVAGCFVAQPVAYAKHTTRDPNAEGGWTPIRSRTLKPNTDQPRYTGPVAVLMGEANMSSCESFLLMMKQVPNCKLIGEKSYGSSGNPKPHDLGNGVVVWLPSWKELGLDGTCLEGKGVDPDIVVRASPRELKTRDPVLQAALDHLNSSR